MEVVENFAWIGWLLSAIIILLIFAMGAMLKKPARLLLTGKITQGVVVGLKIDKKLEAPIVQFTTLHGEQIEVTSNSFSSIKFSKIGDRVKVSYNRATPKDAQILKWSEFAMVGILAVFISFILLLWISAMLMAPDLNMGDPLNIHKTAITHLKLSPTRFPLYFLLPLVIFSCALGSYIHYNTLHERLTKGIKVKGYVNGSITHISRLSDGSRLNANFNTIEYTDLAGEQHQILQSNAKPYSFLKDGEEVEVLYLPNEPENGILNTWIELYPPFLFFTFCFLAFSCLAWLLLRGKIAL